MANDKIVIKGAREHNLKNVNLTLPREKLIVMTGLSGSGKSSLAFDTIYADGQRRYVESLSSYARMFLGRMDKPDVDEITGLSPAISIDQKTTSHNPRSTVGTVTEIYDYLRLLYARVGVHPQRATDPNDMDRVPDRALCDENLRWLKAVLAQTEPTMWAAWGTLIEKRDYLPGLMREMVALTREREIPWVTFGRRSKKGHPHHPLYLRKDSTPEPFDVENYLDTCF